MIRGSDSSVAAVARRRTNLGRFRIRANVAIGNVAQFQITRDDGQSTGHAAPKKPNAAGLAKRRRKIEWLVWLEWLLIFGVFAAASGQSPPDVNESHYLTKAKHFWNPDWCPGDLFLSSSFAHWLFYVAFGWLTKFMSLAAFAWTGRVITWLALAYGWQSLSRKLVPVNGAAVVSAAFFLLLNERFHLAGEWVVGGFEAKGLAYAFVMLAMASLAEKNWVRVWPLLGLAALFHVLVGGWALLAAAFAFLWPTAGKTNLADAIRQELSKNRKSVALTFVILVAAALPPLISDWSADAQLSAAAKLTYVVKRISHHLTFNGFPASHVARFLLLILFGWFITHWIRQNSRSMDRRLSPLVLFAIGSLLINLGGLILSGMAEQYQTDPLQVTSPLTQSLALTATGLLKFYWFRLADFAIPAVVSITTWTLLSHWLIFETRTARRRVALLFIGCVAAATTLMIVENYHDPRPVADRSSLPTYPNDPDRTLETWQNWVRVCQWIRDNTATDAVFITPAEQQTFKWYAGRTEVVCWKDIPQDAVSIFEWRMRVAMWIEPQTQYVNGLLQYTDEQLRDLGQQFDADYVIIPQQEVEMTAGGTELKQVYPTDPKSKLTYVVFEL